MKNRTKNEEFCVGYCLSFCYHTLCKATEDPIAVETREGLLDVNIMDQQSDYKRERNSEESNKAENSFASSVPSLQRRWLGEQKLTEHDKLNLAS